MDDVEIIRRDLSEIKGKLTRMEYYLYDDDSTDSAGIVNRVRSLDNKVQKLEEKDKIKEAKLSVWGIVGGAAVMFFWELFKYIFRSSKS